MGEREGVEPSCWHSKRAGGYPKYLIKKTFCNKSVHFILHLWHSCLGMYRGKQSDVSKNNIYIWHDEIKYFDHSLFRFDGFRKVPNIFFQQLTDPTWWSLACIVELSPRPHVPPRPTTPFKWRPTSVHTNLTALLYDDLVKWCINSSIIARSQDCQVLCITYRL